MPDVALATVALSIAGALGLVLGGWHYRGVGLGIGGVLFAGIFVGHIASAFGISFDPATIEFVREFGLIIFVFTIGVQVGPGFFASLQKSGLQLNLLAASIVVLGVLVTVVLNFVTDIPLPALVGLMSGAVTNTPGLGAATQVLKDVGANANSLALPSLGYAVAYPFGIIGILLTMLLVRFVLRIRIDEEELEYDRLRKRGAAELPAINVAVKNPNVVGLKLGEVPDLYDKGVVASRMRKGSELIHPSRSTPVDMGDVLHLVGPADQLRNMVIILGEEVDVALTTTRGTDMAWERVAVTETKALGKRIRDFGLEGHGVTISRVSRAGTQLSADGCLPLQFGDILTIVGAASDLKAVRGMFGGQQRRLDEVQFSAVFVGIVLGVLAGSIPILLPGLPAPLKLGLAGGPLVVAILLARLGHFGPFVWFMPPVANHALRELGIVLFLAAVGLKAGDKFVETLLNGDGFVWMGYAVLITLVPLLVVGFVGRLIFKVNYLSLSGVLAGSMTDPPALAFANAMSPAAAQSIAYATVYPLVMCLRILAPQILVLFLL
ncbi:MAG: putative transporter [Hyphomicrobiales bacterium]|nr:MAG: putative transporter [Hyphomicrobiales bacterium]